ncbi:Ni/Fe hydrogenase subunit alpha [Thioalkalivibrio sulfidiphilus]|uniref:Nickel-dependent hydrogenase large subunit n=1 Tax=Thioalkalivibrio sulfidiphilus (strain HL-EbGR7) TaxID=396588 RepID=B8GPQ7_THISH|nr:Ni/Fe hydrogenase subunit alpha [Thioalkalivibrio sulfidiphilus]ACL72224.1 nickel-dependent hydrogenase large subunit [Thioalkalivibrio sulfidiphilus HL-EbGr7]
MSQTRTIEVNALARVEGEGALYVRTEGERVAEVKLRIYEPPRFFEGFLIGRDFREAPDITARICGICPVAYQMGASQAIEQVCGVSLDPALEDLRRLIYCGEWIESHGLHVFMLHLPDFLGYPDGITMARDHPELVRNALRIKKIGNALMRLVGGREVHPVNLKVGGFYRAPTPAEAAALREDLAWGLEASAEALDFLAGLDFPDFEMDYEFVSLVHPDEYPILHGRLGSTSGIDAPVEDYDRIFTETHVIHSNALHSHLSETGRPACLGPLARFALNRERLTPRAAALAEKAGLGAVCRNPFKSILVRMVEIAFAFEEALRLVDAYQAPARPAVDMTPRAGTGYGATEAPRGICYHRYTLDEAGIIRDAKIVAPTSVNQPSIEADLHGFVQDNLDLPDDQLRHRCEQVIRNYDPCISCATHFLDLTVERG